MILPSIFQHQYFCIQDSIINNKKKYIVNYLYRNKRRRKNWRSQEDACFIWSIIIDSNVFCLWILKSAIEQQCQSLHGDGLVFVYKHLLQCVNINTVMLRLLEPRKKNRIWVELDIYWHTFDRFFFFFCLASSWPNNDGTCCEHLCSFNALVHIRTHTLSNGKQKHSSFISVFFLVLNPICWTVWLPEACVHQKAQFVRKRRKNNTPVTDDILQIH